MPDWFDLPTAAAMVGLLTPGAFLYRGWERRPNLVLHLLESDDRDQLLLEVRNTGKAEASNVSFQWEPQSSCTLDVVRPSTIILPEKPMVLRFRYDPIDYIIHLTLSGPSGK